MDLAQILSEDVWKMELVNNDSRLLLVATFHRNITSISTSLVVLKPETKDDNISGKDLCLQECQHSCEGSFAPCSTVRFFKKCIGLATMSFHFFPLDDFSRSKSFFSIANFRPYMVFDSWRFIDYSVKKKFQVLFFIYRFALIWNGDSRRSCSLHFTSLLPKR